MEIAERFLGNVEFEDCWEWRGIMFPNGYGRFNIKKRPKMAHRISYELIVGEIPEGLVIDHLCENKGCVNPEHLNPTTQRENVQRGKSKITVCPRGHEYTTENTYIRPRGGRQCRKCRAYHVKRSLAKKFHYNGKWTTHSKDAV